MLSQSDRDWIKEFVAHTAHETAEKIIRDVLTGHVDSCPHGKRLGNFVFVLAGLSALAGMAMPSVVSAAFKLFTGGRP
jgi:hypothetical protein